VNQVTISPSVLNDMSAAIKKIRHTIRSQSRFHSFATYALPRLHPEVETLEGIIKSLENGSNGEENFSVFASDLQGGRGCPCCGGSGTALLRAAKKKMVRDTEGDVTHWVAVCPACTVEVTIWND